MSLNLYGFQPITYRDFAAEAERDGGLNLNTCANLWSGINPRYIATVQGLAYKDCGTCLEVCSEHYCASVLAVDAGGQGLGLSTHAAGVILGDEEERHRNPFVLWKPVGIEACLGLAVPSSVDGVVGRYAVAPAPAPVGEGSPIEGSENAEAADVTEDYQSGRHEVSHEVDYREYAAGRIEHAEAEDNASPYLTGEYEDDNIEYVDEFYYYSDFDSEYNSELDDGDFLEDNYDLNAEERGLVDSSHGISHASKGNHDSEAHHDQDNFDIISDHQYQAHHEPRLDVDVPPRRRHSHFEQPEGDHKGHDHWKVKRGVEYSDGMVPVLQKEYAPKPSLFADTLPAGQQRVGTKIQKIKNGGSRNGMKKMEKDERRRNAVHGFYDAYNDIGDSKTTKVRQHSHQKRDVVMEADKYESRDDGSPHPRPAIKKVYGFISQLFKRGETGSNNQVSMHTSSDDPNFKEYQEFSDSVSTDDSMTFTQGNKERLAEALGKKGQKKSLRNRIQGRPYGRIQKRSDEYNVPVEKTHELSGNSELEELYEARFERLQDVVEADALVNLGWSATDEPRSNDWRGQTLRHGQSVHNNGEFQKHSEAKTHMNKSMRGTSNTHGRSRLYTRDAFKVPVATTEKLSGKGFAKEKHHEGRLRQLQRVEGNALEKLGWSAPDVSRGDDWKGKMLTEGQSMHSEGRAQKHNRTDKHMNSNMRGTSNAHGKSRRHPRSVTGPLPTFRALSTIEKAPSDLKDGGSGALRDGEEFVGMRRKMETDGIRQVDWQATTDNLHKDPFGKTPSYGRSKQDGGKFESWAKTRAWGEPDGAEIQRTMAMKTTTS